MIYTVTANPAVDYAMQLKQFTQGTLNRIQDTTFLPGGKGINVSILLRRLGIDSVVWGFQGGFTGNMLIELLRREKCRSDFIALENGETRINVKLYSEMETELNAAGPKVSNHALQALQMKLESSLKTGDYLVLTGVQPKDVSPQYYVELCKTAHQRGAQVIADTSGETLEAVLQTQPFLIKPNRQELEELVAFPIDDIHSVVRAVKQIQGRGAQSVLVSLGGKGAVFCTQNGEAWFCQAPSIQVCHTVGAGDSLLAGFLAKWMDTKDAAQALRYGVAAGSATAASIWLAETAYIEECLSRIADCVGV